MALEYTALLALAALVIGLIINLRREDEAAQTLEEKWFANVSEPQFYIQRDPSVTAAQSARAEWANAVQMLRETGNKYIQEKDLHLWLWRASEHDKQVEFLAWQALCEADRMRIKNAWIAEKSANLKGEPGQMAGVVWDTKNEN